MEEYNKSFLYWKTQEVEEIFGIAPADNKELLNSWLAAKCEISEKENEQLEYLRQRLEDKVQFWNEAAVKFYFIGPLMNLVKYDNGKYNSFLETPMSLRIDENIKISGFVDFLVATGKQIPRTPFFALHEYKSEPSQSQDPMGQLLVAMVAAQRLNEKIGNTEPLYGVYVIGRFWFFVILKDNKYYQSSAFDATQKDLLQIFCILKEVKKYIEKRV